MFFYLPFDGASVTEHNDRDGSSVYVDSESDEPEQQYDEQPNQRLSNLEVGTSTRGALVQTGLDALHENASNRFYAKDYNEELTELVLGITDQFGPINFDDLCVRIERLHNFSRTGRKIQDRVRELVFGKRKLTKELNFPDVVWPATIEPSSSFAYRGLLVSGVLREWQQIPWPEKVSLAKIASEKNAVDPVSEIMRKLQITRAGSSLRLEFSQAVDGAREVVL